MKRVLTIGRDESCDIHINDNTDVVSRHHAFVEVGRFGKYYIVDQSTNGTYVNGLRIPPQQKYEIRRGDEVSLAHTSLLNWEQVPKDNSLTYIIVGVVSALIVVAAVMAVLFYFDGKQSSSATDIEWVGDNNQSLTPGGTTPIDSNNDGADAAEDDGEEEDAPEEQQPAEETPKQEKPKSNKAAASKEAEKAIVDAIY